MSVSGSVIDIEAWSEVDWRDVVFTYDPAPVILLVFPTEAEARRIFEAWHARLGSASHQDGIRVSIIEGEVEVTGWAYSVHVSGQGAQRGAASVTHREPRAPAAKRLSLLKGAYDHHGTCRLGPAIGEGGPATPIRRLEGLDVADVKLYFRRVIDIGPDDPDWRAVAPSVLPEVGIREERDPRPPESDVGGGDGLER